MLFSQTFVMCSVWVLWGGSLCAKASTTSQIEVRERTEFERSWRKGWMGQSAFCALVRVEGDVACCLSP